MHPGNGCNGKLKITRDNFTVILQRIDDYVHTAGRVCCEANLIRLGINKRGNARSELFALREPIIPMHVAIVHHLLVIALSGLRRGGCERTSCGSIEISAIGCDGKLFADVVPIGHVKGRYTMVKPEGTERKPAPQPAKRAAISVAHCASCGPSLTNSH